MGARLGIGRLRVDLTRSSTHGAPDRGSFERGRARRARRNREDILRIGQRTRELAVFAGLEWSDLVLRARQLGSPLLVRPADGETETPDHVRRRQRDTAAL